MEIFIVCLFQDNRCLLIVDRQEYQISAGLFCFIKLYGEIGIVIRCKCLAGYYLQTLIRSLCYEGLADTIGVFAGAVVDDSDLSCQFVLADVLSGCIKADAVAVLKEMVKKVEPHGIKLSIEFCGCPTMSINRFEDAYAIVEEVNSPLVGITLDQYHFHAMASSFEALEKADGKKIFVWHLNGMENMPCGAAYNNDEKRLWPGEPGDCLDHKRYADTLKKIGFEGDVCTMEVFRPDYYKLSNEENIKTAAEATRAHVAKYWGE